MMTMISKHITCDTRWVTFFSARWVDFTSKNFTVQHEIRLEIHLFHHVFVSVICSNKRSEKKQGKIDYKLVMFLRFKVSMVIFVMDLVFMDLVFMDFILTSRMSRQLASSFGNNMDCRLTPKLNKTTSNRTTKYIIFFTILPIIVTSGPISTRT